MVVSGLPNITPIFMRSWLVKIMAVLDCLIAPESLRSAWLIKPRLQAHVAVAHLAFDLGARDERGDRVHHQHVHRAGADQRFGDLERLLAGVGLGDVQVVNVHAAARGIGGIERVLHVNEGARAAQAVALRR